MTAAGRLGQELQGLGTALAHAEAEVAAGRAIDLGPLETRVGDLCARLTALAPGEARTVRPRMLALLDDFDRLIGTIGVRLDEVKDALGDSNSRRRAISAYGKTARSDGSGSGR